MEQLLETQRGLRDHTDLQPPRYIKCPDERECQWEGLLTNPGPLLPSVSSHFLSEFVNTEVRMAGPGRHAHAHTSPEPWEEHTKGLCS